MEGGNLTLVDIVDDDRGMYQVRQGFPLGSNDEY